MDMWPAYIGATEAHIPEARQKIAFDKFHVAKYLGEALDRVRRLEHRALLGVGQTTLKGSRYQWLTNLANMTRAQRRLFQALRDSTLKTARAWAIKEFAMGLWHYTSRTWAGKGWARWMAWAVRSRLAPMKKSRRDAQKTPLGNHQRRGAQGPQRPRDSMNSRIQRLKKRANDFRNRGRFHNAIYFHLSGLDLYPNGLESQ
jgi:transposase